MARTGRPSKLTDEAAEKIVFLVERGVFPHVAAGTEGISRATFYRWMSQADKAEAELGRLSDLRLAELRRLCRSHKLDASGRKADLVARYGVHLIRLVEFRDSVSAAADRARSVAEARVLNKSPEAWLRYGPGRTTPKSPGWTETYAPEREADEILAPVDAEIHAGKLAKVLNHLVEIGALNNVVPMRRDSGGEADERNEEPRDPFNGNR